MEGNVGGNVEENAGEIAGGMQKGMYTVGNIVGDKGNTVGSAV